jgi:hypothetical protein
MRFAWLREDSDEPAPAQPGPLNRLIFVLYNLVWWLPILLGFTRVLDYRVTFVTFFAITMVRAIANLVRINFLTLEQAELCPFRSP